MPDSPCRAKPQGQAIRFSVVVRASLGFSKGSGWPLYFVSEGLGSNRSTCDGPPVMKRKIARLALGAKCGGLTISGLALMARAYSQAQKFGAEIAIPDEATNLAHDSALGRFTLNLQIGERVNARAVVIATGAQYKKPGIPNLAKFEGQGVYYGATYMEAQLCEGEEAIVVGGGNSAGQAAVYLSQTASKVYVLVRSGQLSDTMSRYLIQRIEQNPAIELHAHSASMY